MRYILGIETSCDETAVSIIQYNKDNFKVLSNYIYSQIEEHTIYQGVVPEIAARTHLDKIDKIFNAAIAEAGILINMIDKIAVTTGPGLVGSLLIGVTFAITISKLLKIECININHLEAHSLSPKLEFDIHYPYLLLLISGGHCQFVSVLGLGKYKILGGTIDDAIGEAFDKVARMLKLGYPGGANIEKAAKLGNQDAFILPKPMTKNGNNDCDMSFSGLKTAVLYKLRDIKNTKQSYNDLAASFQKTITMILEYKTEIALKIFLSKYTPHKRQLAIAGGVAANQAISLSLKKIANKYGFELFVPSKEYCTDNAAMVAYAGMEYDKNHKKYHTNIKSKWSLEDI